MQKELACADRVISGLAAGVIACYQAVDLGFLSLTSQVTIQPAPLTFISHQPTDVEECLGLGIYCAWSTTDLHKD